MSRTAFIVEYRDTIAEFRRECDTILDAAFEIQRYTPQDVAFHGLLIISERLESGRWHYRNRAGELLTALDQVVRAILDKELEGME